MRLKQSEAIVLFEYEGFTLEEIAAILPPAQAISWPVLPSGRLASRTIRSKTVVRCLSPAPE